ncbi:DNA glycosylase [Pluteus cervinus]|uniref:DNA glycosylase n=1 Tax=Pluteus cervinus TaxID=181527 RepID=A0ACD3ALT5_9AGAR|nr:DNA glycosylase [Pluteus cervinus]
MPPRRKRQSVDHSVDNPATNDSRKRARLDLRTTAVVAVKSEVDIALPSLPTESKPDLNETGIASLQSRKLKVHESFSTTSPFPDWPKPTPEEALEVYDLLSKAHHHGSTPLQLESRVDRRAPSVSQSTGETKNSAETCGNVLNVLDALIGVVLSQATSGKGSAAAKHNLDQTFSPGSKNGLNEKGLKALAEAPKSEVVEAIRLGGLANKKADVIQSLLKEVKRRYGRYSLQHLAGEDVDGINQQAPITDDEIMKELISYPGIGPKTASCVLLFCLARPSFAVDTHVFRLSKMLGWVPRSVKADRVKAQMHLDLKIPDHLKYGLHVLFIRHGRVCRGCKKAQENPGDESNEAECILRGYLQTKARAKGNAEATKVKQE